MCECYGVDCGRDGDACLRWGPPEAALALEREKRHVAACLKYYVDRAHELGLSTNRSSFVDLGEYGPDRRLRSASERWPNGAPT